jgi:hypothetical protein
MYGARLWTVVSKFVIFKQGLQVFDFEIFWQRVCVFNEFQEKGYAPDNGVLPVRQARLTVTQGMRNKPQLSRGKARGTLYHSKGKAGGKLCVDCILCETCSLVKMRQQSIGA